MDTDSGATRSLWMATADVPGYGPLAEDLTVDVCVVGAGVAGLTVAYQLLRDGRSVAVLDDGPVAGGESSRTTAHLASALDDRYFEIERMFDSETARLAAESHAAAIDLIEQIVAHESIDCDFARVDGYLFAETPYQGSEELHREYEAARRAGLDVSWAEHAPIAGFHTGACLKFARQGQLHPVRYFDGLARGVTRLGGRIFGGTHVESVENGEPCVVATSDGRTVTADAVVVATNSPFSELVSMHTKQAPYRTYVVAGRVPKGSATTALFWDTPDPYHYVRLQPGRDGEELDYLIAGGEDHKTGQATDFDERFARLEAWTRERWPALGPVEYRWSGQVMEPIDALGYIGRAPLDPNVYLVTGDSGNGMTHGTLAGILIADLVAGRENPWAAVYDPARVTVDATAGLEFLKENLNVAGQYAEWITGGDVSSTDEVLPGEGAVMRDGLTFAAVYRDEGGALHKHSAKCTHLGCVVRFNALEQTWDCPCHGSRFAADDGHVVNGPAVSPLGQWDEAE